MWEAEQKELQLDIETDIEPYWCTKKLITIQFGQVGSTHGIKAQWILQWSELTEEQRLYIKGIIEGPKTKLIHNASFEIIMLRFYGMNLTAPFDTMLAEKILNGGIENENYALSDLCFKYIYITLDKSEQKTFGDNILTENKVVYAANDVIHLDVIRGHQMPEIEKHKLGNLMELENEVCLAFSDITFHGMELDRNKWRENEELAQPIVDASQLRLNEWLTQEPFRSKAIAAGYLSESDTLRINFGSPQQKTELIQMVFPDIDGGSLPIIKKYIRDNGSKLKLADLNIMVSLQEKNTQPLNDRLVLDHKEALIERGFLLPANVPDINWNSTDQALTIARAIAPRMQNMSEESTANQSHPFFDDLSEYKDSLKLTGQYGSDFFKYIEPDGRVRTSFNQIVSTGRVSSKSPNMQNIPAKESVGTRYRNAFVCAENEVFVDSDFTGQELAIIAHVSKDPIWIGCMERNEDLHSVCAEMIYGTNWLAAKAEGCAYYAKVEGGIAKQKCKCAGHKTFRNAVKTVNFGLAYGMGGAGLSRKIRSTKAEADALIELYFKTFPKIGNLLKFLGEYGVKNGVIQTIAPYNRKRWFPFWKFAKGRIPQHLAGNHDATLGEIERASKNQPEHCYGLNKSGELRELYGHEAMGILSQAA